MIASDKMHRRNYGGKERGASINGVLGSEVAQLKCKIALHSTAVCTGAVPCSTLV